MECPKCSAVQAEGRDECASCGVVFARFRDAQVRAAFRPITQSQRQAVPAVAPSEERSIPVWMIAVAAGIVLLLGMVWTSKRRAERETQDLAAEGTAMLDEINSKGVQQRRRLQEEASRARPSWEASVAAPRMRSAPVGLDPEQARIILDQCPGFVRMEYVELPKIVPDYGRGYTLEQYPALSAAEENNVVALEKEGGNYRVTLLPSMSGRMQVSETGSNWVISVGRRRVKSVSQLYCNDATASGRFTYDFDDSFAARMLLRPGVNFEGNASFVKKDGSWRASKARPDQKGIKPVADLCS